mgnify:CR=1 FL=1
MQWHGHDDVAFIQQRAAGTVEPAREAGDKIEPVGMLERQDGAAALLVVAHDGTRPVEGWRISETGRTERVASGIKLERQPAALASGPIEEVDVLPARRTQAARLRDLSTATDAERGIQEVEDLASGLPQPTFYDGAHKA